MALRQMKCNVFVLSIKHSQVLCILL